MTDEIRQNVLRLMKQKDKMEGEIQQLTQILSFNGVGMDDPLVDSEGFPISSIDVYQVRHARHRIICLQNDHKAIMKQIENGLQGYYSSRGAQSNDACEMEVTSNHDLGPAVHETPFARITLVSPSSPADLAGFCPNDEVVEFGSVNADNFKNLIDVASVVQHSENCTVIVKIRRNGRFVTIPLVPRKWQGKGLLGCNIDILK